MVKPLLNSIKYLLKEGRFLKNVNKRVIKKPRVLISYTIFPFLNRKVSHSSYQESLEIAETFDQLGYCVDVIHYTNQKHIDYTTYDVIFGFGEPFENSFKYKSNNLKRIYYATGAHVFHQNLFESNRVKEFNKKYNSKLLPKRLVPWCWTLSTTFSDYLLVIGNSWTVSTYQKFTNKPVIALNASALINVNVDKIHRKIDSAKKEFLWFGSSGLIHKGLDLCLAYFSERPDLFLHICGPKEPEFFNALEHLLHKPNIFYHGFVDVSTPKFIEITSRCLFGILPSCSEGQATSLLTTMSAGLIPIASEYTGIDILEHGFILESLNIESIEESINLIEQIGSEELKVKSERCAEYIMNHHTLDSFKKNIFIVLSRCLNE